jgi:two-component system, OmpR family, heavy metal sensor histidine kinase CusS
MSSGDADAASVAMGLAAEAHEVHLAPGQRAKRWSMATQLTLYYTVCTCVLLAIATAALYWTLERTLMDESRAYLVHKLQVLALITQRQPLDTAGLEQEVRDEAEISAQSPSPFQLRVLDRMGSPIAETPGMASTLPIASFPKPIARTVSESTWHSGAQTFLLEAQSAVTPDGRWVLEAALDITGERRLLARYRRDLTLLMTVGLVLAAAFGAWMTHRGLRPIGAITRTVQCIGAQRLADRLQPGAWPRELSALASEFNRMLERLQGSFERLSQFSADLAHELRTPIHNLMGEAQVTLTQERTASDYKRVLVSGLEEQARLARMIDSMLFLAQADQARLRLAPMRLDARAETQSVVDFYQALADEQGVELRCEGVGSVTADPILLRRALSNLVSNALKFTPSAGSVTLQVGQADSGTSFSVSDTGIGVAAEHLPKLGARFYRVDPSRTESTGGVGLGLAIVRSIMLLHGGRLEIESRVGRGTIVSLIFPDAQDDRPVILSRSTSHPT